MTREDRVAEFLTTSGQTPSLNTCIVIHDEETGGLYKAIDNWRYAPTPKNRAAMVKEWADTQYTLSQLAVALHIDADEAFKRVADSNMTKVANGVQFREDGKIMKGPNYKKPDMGGL